MMMTFHKGTARCVVCIPLLRIVLKLPIIHIRNAFHMFKFGIKVRQLLELLTCSVYKTYSVKGQLFRGFAENWNEYRFYLKTKHQFIQPTYFSLFGIVNFQKMGNICNLSRTNHWTQIAIITNEQAHADSHHFGEASNFCLEGSVLKILDYGNPKTQDVVMKFGTIIQEKYDVNFSWEEYKETM